MKPWKAAVEAKWRESPDDLKAEITAEAERQAREIASYVGTKAGSGEMIQRCMKYVVLSKVFGMPLPPRPTVQPDCQYCFKTLRPDHGWVCDTEGCDYNKRHGNR